MRKIHDTNGEVVLSEGTLCCITIRHHHHHELCAACILHHSVFADGASYK